nr:MAG TPA: hypothetical protein [Caudoviricetes sp.]
MKYSLKPYSTRDCSGPDRRKFFRQQAAKARISLNRTSHILLLHIFAKMVYQIRYNRGVV